jgi:hypothetical protein
MEALTFDDLRKIPPQPAARMLAAAGAKLSMRLAAPASAPVSVVLAELAEKDALFDMLHLMAVVLPGREAVWWACLAGRDMVPEGQNTPSLAAAEAWVFKPDDTHRAAAQRAMEAADPDDETVYCALAAVYADGRMGTGELAQQPAPPAAVPAAVLAMNLKALDHVGKGTASHGWTLLSRALDIARGGNGHVAAVKSGALAASPEPVAEGQV